MFVSERASLVAPPISVQIGDALATPGCGLRALVLAYNTALGDAGTAALARRAPEWRGLGSLDLRGVGCGAGAAAALAEGLRAGSAGGCSLEAGRSPF